MRCSTLVALTFALVASAQNNNNKQGNNGGNNGQNQGGAGAGAAAGGDPQTSLTLDPKAIADFSKDGQDPPVAGQVASLTSKNNFINFCLTRPDLPLTNGKQIKTGSCNPAPIGLIPSTQNMPSSKFTNPKNGDTIGENTPFTISMAIKNLVSGNFVNAQANYFAAPQQLQNGVILGHSHVVVEKLTALDQTTPTDPNVFAFFKGLNGAAQGGVLTADVTEGLPAGFYRLASINAAANHQPAIVPVAQHGSLDDAIYFTVGKVGAGGAAAGGAAAGGAAAGATGGAAAGGVGNGGAAAAPVDAGQAQAAPAQGQQGGNNAANGQAAGAGRGQGRGQGRGRGGQGGRAKRMFPSRMAF